MQMIEIDPNANLKKKNAPGLELLMFACYATHVKLYKNRHYYPEWREESLGLKKLKICFVYHLWICLFRHYHPTVKSLASSQATVPQTYKTHLHPIKKNTMVRVMFRLVSWV